MEEHNNSTISKEYGHIGGVASRGCDTRGGVAPEGVWPLKMKISITQLFLKPGTLFFFVEERNNSTLL